MILDAFVMLAYVISSEAPSHIRPRLVVVLSIVHNS